MSSESFALIFYLDQNENGHEQHHRHTNVNPLNDEQIYSGRHLRIKSVISREHSFLSLRKSGRSVTQTRTTVSCSWGLQMDEYCIFNTLVE